MPVFKIFLDCGSGLVTLAQLQFHMERSSGELIRERLQGRSQGWFLEGDMISLLAPRGNPDLTAAWFISEELMSLSIINFNMLPQKG